MTKYFELDYDNIPETRKPRTPKQELQEAIAYFRYLDSVNCSCDEPELLKRVCWHAYNSLQEEYSKSYGKEEMEMFINQLPY